MLAVCKLSVIWSTKEDLRPRFTGMPPTALNISPRGKRTIPFHHETGLATDGTINNLPINKSQLEVWGAAQITHLS